VKSYEIYPFGNYLKLIFLVDGLEVGFVFGSPSNYDFLLFQGDRFLGVV
jgi:hypothetical protein